MAFSHCSEGPILPRKLFCDEAVVYMHLLRPLLNTECWFILVICQMIRKSGITERNSVPRHVIPCNILLHLCSCLYLCFYETNVLKICDRNRGSLPHMSALKSLRCK